MENSTLTPSEIFWFKNEFNNRNAKVFFNRFKEIEYTDLKILDLGCGAGALAIDCALNKGASKVIGIDLYNDAIISANKILSFKKIVRNRRDGWKKRDN